MSAKSGEHQTPERELEDGILACNVTPSDFRVFLTLLKMADRGTAVLPPRWQPKSLVALADRCFISLAGVKRSLNHLEAHGWIERYQYAGGRGGRSHPTHYKLCLGVTCNCKAAQPEPDKARKPAQRESLNRLTTELVSAVQADLSRGRAVAGEKGKGEPKPEYTGGPKVWDWPEDSYGAEANPKS